MPNPMLLSLYHGISYGKASNRENETMYLSSGTALDIVHLLGIGHKHITWGAFHLLEDVRVVSLWAAGREGGEDLGVGQGTSKPFD